MQQDAAAQARTERWNRWHTDFWKAITNALGDGDSPDPYRRRFGDLYVMLDFLDDDGQIQLSVVGTPLPSPGTRFGAPCHRVYWDDADADGTAQTVLGLVQKVRDDPIHRMMQPRRTET